MKSSIIIPTYNKALWLELVLYSLCECDGIAECEVIIIDDGSNDNTKHVVTTYKNKINVKYINQDNLGAGKARNTGVMNAKGDILIFIDDDRIVNRGFIQAHVQMHDMDSGKIIVIGKRQQLFLANLECKRQSIMLDISKGLMEYSKLSRIDDYEKITDLLFDKNGYTDSKIVWISCIFANASIKRKDFIENGMFDGWFHGWGCEDIEVGYRLFKNGIKYVLNKEIVNYHLEHGRNASIPEEYHRNFEYMKKKHGAVSIDLYQDFVDGKLSLEKYNANVTYNNNEYIYGDQHFYKHMNMFRENGMNRK